MYREAGTGPCRLGSSIEIGDDVYSMLFASCIRYDYIYYCRDIKGGKFDVPDEDEDEQSKPEPEVTEDKLLVKDISSSQLIVEDAGGLS